MTENDHPHRNYDTIYYPQSENSPSPGFIQLSDEENHYLIYLHEKYTTHIVDFEKHIIAVHAKMIVTTHDKNTVLQELNSTIKEMIKIFNNCLIKKYKERNNVSSINDCRPPESIQSKKLMFDNISALESFESNPFNEIREKLIVLGKIYGYTSINKFFQLLVNEQYQLLFSKKNNEIIHIYDDVFVPISISIVKKSIPDDTVTIKKIHTKYDKLIDNVCTITMYFMSRSGQIEVTFTGYIASDPLNAYVRTSQIHSKYLYRNKKEFEQIIRRDYPDIDAVFFSQYTKIIGSYIYYVNSPAKNAALTKKLHDMYLTLSTKGSNNIIKMFLQSDVKGMHRIINALLMGNEKMINTASLLFDLLLDKKNRDSCIRDIIFSNLSYHAQNLMQVATLDMTQEIAKLKAMTTESVPIEKKLLVMVDMPDAVKAYIIEKTNEIKTGDNNSKLQTAITNLMQFPWKPKNYKSEYEDIRLSMIKSRNYLDEVGNKLASTVYGHEHSKKTLVELVGKWMQKPGSHGQVLGFAGPPGVGKTLLAKSVGDALNIPFTIVGLGGVKDSSDLIGHNFTYANSQCGSIVRQMIKSGKWRSMIFFDEVDKVSKNNDTNEIFNTLIHITDPNMNKHFQDRFYSSAIDFDLSGVLFIFAYNNPELLDPILLDRIKEIKFLAYSVNEKVEITKRHILKELLEEINFPLDKIIFTDEIIKYIIDKYTNEAGIRKLKGRLDKILSKINVDRYYMRGPFMTLMYQKYVELHGTKHKLSDISNKLEIILGPECVEDIFNFDFPGSIEVSRDIVHEYLDKPLALIEEIHKVDLVGKINGLYASTLGIGGIVPIEICKKFVGDPRTSIFNLKMTGNQKKVMKESVECALSVAISIINKKDVMKDYTNGFHIHALDAGTPKDGPSAGCAFTTAFVSLLLGKKINRLVAMTGEIELSGKINKIGGLVAKLVGAKKAGVTRVYICTDNKEDYEAIKKKDPGLFDDTFEIKIVSHIIDILMDPFVIPGVSRTDFCKDVIKNYHSTENVK